MQLDETYEETEQQNSKNDRYNGLHLPHIFVPDVLHLLGHLQIKYLNEMATIFLNYI